MRLLLLYNKKNTAYSRNVLALLADYLNQKNYFTATPLYSFPLSKTTTMPENEVVIKAVVEGFFSFFQTLYLRNLIKKRQLKWVVQVSNKKLFTTRLPQLIIPNHAEQIRPNKSGLSSTKIILLSEWERQKLIGEGFIPEQNIAVIPVSAGSTFQPLSWSEKQSLKMQYTQGKEYFIADVDGKTEETFTSLLKAFSAFKKWQHSSMKLVVERMPLFTQSSEWKEKMSSYKYRDDIVNVQDGKDNNREALLAGAYAFVHTPVDDNDVIPLLQAMQCGTPVISFLSNNITEYAASAVCGVEKDSYDALGEAMIRLYKDETLRSRLIEEGKTRAQQYTRDKAMQALRAVLPSGIH